MSMMAMIPNFSSYMNFIPFVFSMLLRCFVNILDCPLGNISNMLSNDLFFIAISCMLKGMCLLLFVPYLPRRIHKVLLTVGFIMANPSSCF